MKVASFALVIVIIGCASVQSVSAAESAKFKEKVLYSFCGQANCTDGSLPFGGLIDVKGMLYGTTATGGANDGGAVFAVDRKSGAEQVLHSFCQQQNCADGQLPVADLIDVRGVLYGTTNMGGTYGGGTVFALDTGTGTETVVYSFCSQGNCTDGQSPSGSLLDMNGKLYGTTFYGGISDNGTVFVVDARTGAEKVLYSFCSQQNCADGALPSPSLLYLNGTLYGTTDQGGLVAGGCATGCGTVFTLDLSTGRETVLYAFCQQQNCADGKAPLAGFIDVNGVLYSTTAAGGAYGGGTVFSLDPSTGAESVVHSFGSGNDGKFPEYAALRYSNGTLYGTTPYGGRDVYGTVFALDPGTGAESVLHSFCSRQNCADGEMPFGGLLHLGGKLFGTTSSGGAYGEGTMFAIKNLRARGVRAN